MDVLWIWAETLTRWLHVLAGIAWIGSSFYFVALDLSLKRREGLPDKSFGEAWQIHGGGFYNMVKYTVAPDRLPNEVKWFYWEAYTTWLSGFGLMVLIYFAKPEIYLIDEAVLAMAPWQAIAASIAVLVVGWAAYDGLCRSPLKDNDVALMGVGFVALVATAYGLTHVFSDRGAFLMMGALIGTIMVANVAMVIIPGQRKVVAALIAGETPEAEYGRRGKQRSLHNNYLTLPVVFIMLAGHYPLVYATEWSWLILAIVLVIGVLIRHFYNTSHRGDPAPWWTWGAVAAAVAAVIWLSTAAPDWDAEQAALGQESWVAEPFDLALAHEIVATRCSMCHAAEPYAYGLTIPPKGVVLETPEDVARWRDDILQQAVWSNAMPPGNVTYMEPAERLALGAWAESAAR